MPDPEPRLTPRRREIAILLTEGRTVDEIAGMLTVTRDAVADDVEYLLARLDHASRAEVASWAGAPARWLWIVRPERGEHRAPGGSVASPASSMERSG
jgi:DNA-binding CsgD family transcriptional regulator